MGMSDDEYLLQTSHLEQSLIDKIESNEYFDLVKLMPREKYCTIPMARCTW